MYAKLVFKNAKRSVKDYSIYIVTMTVCVTLFYAFLSVSSRYYHPTIGAEYNISLQMCIRDSPCAGLLYYEKEKSLHYCEQQTLSLIHIYL